MADTKDADASATRKKRADKSAFGFEGREEQATQTDESLGTLLRQLADQGAHLAEKQVELIKAEIRSSVTHMEEAVGAMAGAAVLGIAGFGVTLMGIAYVLGTFLSMWLATLIVGVATLIGAWAMYAAGRSKISAQSLNLDRSEHTIRRAPAAVSGQTKEDRRNG